MLKKIWNHRITIGDSVVYSIAATVIGLAGTAIWYFGMMHRLKKMDESIDHSNGLYEDEAN